MAGSSSGSQALPAPVPPKTGTSSKPCRFFQQGHCRLGAGCQYSHEEMKPLYVPPGGCGAAPFGSLPKAGSGIVPFMVKGKATMPPPLAVPPKFPMAVAPKAWGPGKDIPEAVGDAPPGLQAPPEVVPE